MSAGEFTAFVQTAKLGCALQTISTRVYGGPLGKVVQLRAPTGEEITIEKCWGDDPPTEVNTDDPLIVFTVLMKTPIDDALHKILFDGAPPGEEFPGWKTEPGLVNLEVSLRFRAESDHSRIEFSPWGRGRRGLLKSPAVVEYFRELFRQIESVASFYSEDGLLVSLEKIDEPVSRQIKHCYDTGGIDVLIEKLAERPEVSQLKEELMDELHSALWDGDGESSERLVTFRISPGKQRRLDELLAKNRDGILTPDEAAELEAFAKFEKVFRYFKDRVFNTSQS